MAQTQRQTKLFAAEDYTAVYESYINANFQAYDYDTIRDSMVEYIRTNYPESYTDWVESAEFVSLLDVIARFGHSLAFRVDLNARNNFLSTADKTESVYKLSEFLGYTPRRNSTASGFVKVISVKTNEDVIGNNGTTLAGQEFNFENSTTADNLDNFVNVMNAIFSSTNPYGSPTKQVTIGGVQNQFYNLNNTSDQLTFSFNGIAQGVSTIFNAYSVDYDTDMKNYVEKDPNPVNAFTMLYKNDGQGILSDNTGFFFGLKEGNLDFQDFNVSDPISGMTLDLDSENINNTDVWVQTINAEGAVSKTWTKVNQVHGTNVQYNSLASGVRDIFSVKSLSGNKVSIQFADSTLGNLPKGIIRVWHRTSLNETYSLRPDDIGIKRINVKYVGADNNTYSATMTVQLRKTINTASSGESLNDIKTSAPQAFASQNRMITANDYNGLLLTTTDSVKKIKAVNRTHSGFSRYVDMKDPTGAYSNLRLFATDGILTKTEHTKETIMSDVSAAVVFDKHIRKAVSDDEMINLYYDKFLNTFTALKTNYTVNNFLWTASTQYPLTGYFRLNDAGQNYPIYGVGDKQTSYLKFLKQGALLKFTSGTRTYWAQVNKVYNQGLGIDDGSGSPTGISPDDQGAIGLDRAIPTSATLDLIVPALSRQFTASERSTVIDYIKAKQTFALKFDYANTKWEIIERDPLPTASDTAMPGDFDITSLEGGKDNNWLLHINYTTSNNIDKWTMTQRVVRYKLASSQIEFSNITNEFYMDGETRRKKRDTIAITDTTKTELPNATFYIYGYDFVTDGSKSGIYDPTKVILSIVDSDANDRPDNPDSYANISPEVTITNAVVNGSGTITYTANNTFAVGDTVSIHSIASSAGDLNLLTATIAAATSTDFTVTSTATGTYSSGGKATHTQNSDLRFEWSHIPDSNELIDPSFTNLIDVFTLTSTYDTAFRTWLADETGKVMAPTEDTISSLASRFEDQTSKKAMSDSIIYRPCTYLPLFGSKSKAEHRAKFRIIKTPGTQFTDNEIKNKVVDAMAVYFDPGNWDFGETFYFTELAAHIHKELSGVISSFVIVPLGTDTSFGDLFQITPLKGELLIPDVGISDIDIIDSITQENINQAQGV